jgi:hypothetical protein
MVESGLPTEGQVYTFSYAALTVPHNQVKYYEVEHCKSLGCILQKKKKEKKVELVVMTCQFAKLPGLSKMAPSLRCLPE